jgi:hypothetical protein
MHASRWARRRGRVAICRVCGKFLCPPSTKISGSNWEIRTAAETKEFPQRTCCDPSTDHRQGKRRSHDAQSASPTTVVLETHAANASAPAVIDNPVYLRAPDAGHTVVAHATKYAARRLRDPDMKDTLRPKDGTNIILVALSLASIDVWFGPITPNKETRGAGTHPLSARQRAAYIRVGSRLR